ncbi:nucleoside recognition domain-containing protein [Roseateles sp. BYS180W]|uniref:Nucleoside recognition domain-containing protein n=1 Tax=Roseateles rivi TaxID=3299028 RepID=A0ABW7FT65_9BURK
MVLNVIWIAFFLIGLAVALWRAAAGDGQVLAQMLSGIFDTAKVSVDISLGLVGVMCLWLGLMKVGEHAGVIQLLARVLAPLLARLMPQVPRQHPANGAVVMNVSANMLGLDNAATPLGLKAMQELQAINPKPDEASNPMILFLVLNTAGITLIPSSVIAMRQTLAMEQGLTGFNAADILLPTLVATFISFTSGLLAVAWVQRLKLLCLPVLALFGGFAALMGGLWWWLQGFEPAQMTRVMGALGAGSILLLMGSFIAVGAWRRVNVYESFVEGAKEGFGVAVQIIPYLVAMLVAISVFRTSGCMDLVVGGVARGVASLGLPTEWVAALPVGLMKTLSGSGARALMVDVMNTYGVASFEGRLAAIIQGSTETTFYVLAVYFGSVNIRKTRHALPCALVADLVGLIGAILVGYAFFA